MPIDCCQPAIFFRLNKLHTYLFVEIEMSERELDSFSNFLLLHVESSNVGIRNIRLFMSAKHGYRRVGFWRQDVHKRIGVTMEGDRGGWFELFSIQGGENADHVIRTRG